MGVDVPGNRPRGGDPGLWRLRGERGGNRPGVVCPLHRGIPDHPDPGLDELSTDLPALSQVLSCVSKCLGGNERTGRPMEKTRINGAKMGHQASRLVSDARDFAQTSVDEGKAFVSRQAVPFMIGTFIL